MNMVNGQLKAIKTVSDEGKNGTWKIDSSVASKNCKNYIREIVDSLKVQPNPVKPVIALSIGDPTIYGNLRPPDEAVQAVITAALESNFNGYAPCEGYENSREAVAQYLSHDGAKFSSADIILCSGCSSALEICILALCDAQKKHNLIMPRPGFSIYQTLAETIGVNVKYYNLIPEKNWEIDLKHLKSQIDYNTAVIVLNNPSNPCGSVYREKHLRDVLEIAWTHKIPVIADEIYEQIVFSGNKFVSIAALNSSVPLLVCGGLSKRFLAPGWRLGWIAVHDKLGIFKENIRDALINLSRRTIGSNTLIQAALPDIFHNTPQSFHDNLIHVLEDNAKLVHQCLQKIAGLKPYMPQGTMYMMVECDLSRFPFQDISDFVRKLMEEESVFCLPGNISRYMRIILTLPQELLLEACNRLSNFCKRFYIL